MGWKGEESAATKSIPSTDIKWIQWLRVARNYQIRVGMKDGTRETFDGFIRDVRPFHFPPPSLLTTLVLVLRLWRTSLLFFFLLSRIMRSWFRCSNNISAYSSSRRRYRSEGGIGVRLISKVLPSSITRWDLPRLTLTFSRSRSRVSRRTQNGIRTPPPVRRKLEHCGSNGSLSRVPTSKPYEIETVQIRSRRNGRDQVLCAWYPGQGLAF